MSDQLPFPNLQSPWMVNGQPTTHARSFFYGIWNRSGGAIAASPIVTLTGASPYAYTAQNRGSVIVSGGTVTGITLKRGATTINVTSPVPVSPGDVVTVTYTAAPTMSFVQA